jgi:ABC-type dipeptide/oligopeptide/nickel transport system permease component/ABC-type transport system substrate-binding protein
VKGGRLLYCVALLPFAALPTFLAAPSQAADAPGAPRPERVTIGMQLEPPILDPAASPAAAISEILVGNVFEGLVAFAADGSVVPKLAVSWDVEDEGLTYIFHLRRDVRFHDGAEFDAAAVKFSLDRARGSASVNPQKSRLAKIRSVEIIDPLTVRVDLAQRSGGLLQSLAFGAFVMVSPSSAAANATHPVGTGPFRFSAWRRGDSLTLTRSSDYWGTSAHLSEATFKFIADPTAAYAALMAGDVDAFANYPAPESFAQFAADRRFAAFTGSTEMETILAFNQRVPPLDNLLVRRAISYALDRRDIIDGAMFGYGIPIGSHFPPRNPAYIDLTGVYPHDPAKARALLTAAGYPSGLSLSLKLPPPSYARRAGEIVAAELAQVGIRVNIENLEWAQWLDQVFARHDFVMSIVGHAEPLDYDIYARDDYYFGYANADFKALLAALDDTLDAVRRQALLQQIQRKLALDAVNGFLFQYPRLDVWNVRLQGVGFDNVLGVVDLSRAQVAAADSAGAGWGGDHRSGVVEWPLTRRVSGALFCAVALMLCLWATRRQGAAYLAERLTVLAATMLAATAVVFVMVQVVPGDPVRLMLGLQADPATVAAIRHQVGLDAAPLQRYVQWVAGLLRGDFGLSYTYRIPVGSLIAERLHVSLPLALYALLLAAAVAFPIGLTAAALRGRAGDAALSSLTQLGLAIPNFWLGMLLVMVFAIGLHLVSAGGFPGWDAGFWACLKALTLPAIALAMPQAAILARVLRGALIDTLHEDYIRTARAKGAAEWQVLWHHALPNALSPVLTILGMQFSFLLAGGVIIENVFFLPGLGRLAFQAIVQRDLIVVQSVVVVLVFAVVTVSFLVDLSYAAINPRLREAPLA